ncbi:MAG: hypothetical protein ACYDHA_02885 [Bellilinea sp.]
MKTYISVVLCLVMLFTFVGTVSAVKPEGTGAIEVSWNLSADVMPVPPYGSIDIPGSDTASKLIVNQPNGNTEITITGVMNGLLPNTTYTVYPSKAWSTSSAWNVSGYYTIYLTVGSTPYTEYLTLVQTGNSITGTYLALDTAGTQSRWNIDSGSVTGNALVFYAHYQNNLGMRAQFNATINLDGSMTGTWKDLDWNNRSGLWYTTSGTATSYLVGGWPGLFPGQSTFTFVTDASGSGSWHLNLKNEDFTGPGTHTLSIWINGSDRTVLISNNFDVIVE